MPLLPGHKLGPYEILSPLGAGGMGEVYRARDTRLGRDVAIKVLPEHLSAAPEVRARFDREARTVSSLNHPHICVLHDIGSENGVDYLVMELVEGETLAQRLERGPIPPADALRIGVQIADALDRAHRAGIIHRDLKPGNVMLAPSGVKLMDFGLARVTGLAGPAGGSGLTMAALTQSPTVAQSLTAEGTIVGTFQYMSPEQLEGREADPRSDIWALGCVLYEMATRRRAFQGSSQASLIASIMQGEPKPLTELAPMTPPALERVVKLCLAKDPEDRWQSARDLKRELEWIGGTGSSASAAVMHGGAIPAPPSKGGLRRYLMPALALVAIIGVPLALFATSSRRFPPAETMNLELTPLSSGRMSAEPGDVALSPDGRRVAYVVFDSLGTRRLWVQRLDEIDGRPIGETETAERPFWSPDSRMIAFFSRGDRSTLKKVPADGGTPVVICETVWARGGAWGSKDVIVFASAAEGPLSRVSAMGGEVTPATELDLKHGETAHRFPSFLPDGEHFVYASLPNSVDGCGINLGSLGSLTTKRLGSAFSAATYAEPGYLLFDRENKLVAQRLDLKRLELVGEAIPIGAAPPGTLEDASRIVSASRTGSLAVLRREPRVAHLEWFDLDGTRTRLPLASAHYNEVSLSPDGRSALLSVRTSRYTTELIRYDLERGIVTRLTAHRSINNMPVWSRDGNVIAHTSTRSGREEIYLQSANGAGEARLIATTDAQFKSPNAWSRDGRYVVFTQMTSDNFDVYLKDVTTGAPPTPLVTGPGYQGVGYISPDGRWLVYASDEDVPEQFGLYVVSFPDGQHKTKISNLPITAFRWSPRRNTILFIGWYGDLYAVDVAGDDTPIPQPPRLLANVPFRGFPGFRMFDVSPEGERLLVLVTEPERRPPGISLIVNWPGILAGR